MVTLPYATTSKMRAGSDLFRRISLIHLRQLYRRITHQQALLHPPRQRDRRLVLPARLHLHYYHQPLIPVVHQQVRPPPPRHGFRPLARLPPQVSLLRPLRVFTTRIGQNGVWKIVRVIFNWTESIVHLDV